MNSKSEEEGQLIIMIKINDLLHKTKNKILNYSDQKENMKVSFGKKNTFYSKFLSFLKLFE